MNVERMGKTQMKILLSEAEMKRVGLSLEGDPSGAHTRALLLSLLEETREESGFEYYGHRLLIELYPQEGGGCAIYYKIAGSMTERLSKPALYGPVLFTFTDVDILIEAACRLFYRYCHRIYKSSLYRLGNSYRLIVYPLDRVDSVTVSFLSEFAEKSGEGCIAAALVEEHGTPIVLENAIDMFSDYFSDTVMDCCANSLNRRILLP